MPHMRTLHVGLRVSDQERSLAFYSAVGYAVIGTVEGTAYGTLTMLQLPGDDFVTIELVYDPAKREAGPGVGINHLVIQVESLDATRADLAAKGIEPGPVEYPGGAAGPRSGRLPDRGGPVAGRPRRRHDRGRLRLSRRTPPARTRRRRAAR
jgi:lactoylglutathione lyase